MCNSKWGGAVLYTRNSTPAWRVSLLSDQTTYYNLKALIYFRAQRTLNFVGSTRQNGGVASATADTPLVSPLHHNSHKPPRGQAFESVNATFWTRVSELLSEEPRAPHSLLVIAKTGSGGHAWAITSWTATRATPNPRLLRFSFPLTN